MEVSGKLHAPGTNWVDTRADLDVAAKRNNPAPAGESNSSFYSHSDPAYIKHCKCKVVPVLN